MASLKRLERAAVKDVRVALVREVLPLAIIVVMAVALQQLTHHLSAGKP